MRPELDAISTTFDIALSIDDVLTHWHDCVAPPWALKDNLSFERHLTQKCRHSRRRLAIERHLPKYIKLQ